MFRGASLQKMKLMELDFLKWKTSGDPSIKGAALKAYEYYENYAPPYAVGHMPDYHGSNTLARVGWMHKLNKKERKAYAKLRLAGLLSNHKEPVTWRTEVFGAKDILGKEIHIQDVVRARVDITDEETQQTIVAGTEAIVIAMLTEEDIQINPVNAGLPMLVSPEELEVIDSFITKIKSIQSMADAQEILSGAEKRLEEAGLSRRPTKRASSGGVKRMEVPSKPMTLDLGEMDFSL